MVINPKAVFLLLLCLLRGGAPLLHGQNLTGPQALFFISDCQQPLPVEKIIRKSPHNIEGRDMLFREIGHNNTGNVFMLGDIVGKSYKSK